MQTANDQQHSHLLLALCTAAAAVRCSAVPQVDIDENSDAAKDAGIMSVPTFMFFKEGAMISKVL